MKIGEKKGKLTLIKKVSSINGEAYGIFSCACGNQKGLRIRSVRNDLTKSCGCLRDDIHRESRMKVGEKINHLTLLSLVKRDKKMKNTFKYGLFRCDCGNEKVIRISAVMRGNNKGCGCRLMRYEVR